MRIACNKQATPRRQLEGKQTNEAQLLGLGAVNEGSLSASLVGANMPSKGPAIEQLTGKSGIGHLRSLRFWARWPTSSWMVENVVTCQKKTPGQAVFAWCSHTPRARPATPPLR